MSNNYNEISFRFISSDLYGNTIELYAKNNEKKKKERAAGSARTCFGLTAAITFLASYGKIFCT
jgi:hypothetical protein